MKMKKNLFIFVFVITVLFLGGGPLFAYDYIIDGAGLLSDINAANFEAMAKKIASDHNFEPVVLTVKSLEGETPEDYSRAILKDAGLNNDNWDGCLFLLAIESNDFVFTPLGRGEKLLNNSAYTKMEDKVRSCLNKKDYWGAFNSYFSTWEKYLVQGTDNNSFNFAGNPVIDDAGILSAQEKTRLKTMIEEISAAYNFNLIILTVQDLYGEDAIDFSWDVLDEAGYYGTNWDGCLLLVSPGARDYCFTASGRGEKILNNAAYNRLEDEVVDYLHDNNYFGAFKIFVDTWKVYLELESKGITYNALRKTSTHVTWLVIVWVLGLLVGLIVVAVMKSKMNTVAPKKEADSYIIPNSLALTQQLDTFLYSSVSKVRKSSSSSGGGGGGSSRSGGGRSSRSGKY